MNTVEIDGEQLTYEQAFRKMWNWLADNPKMGKDDFFNTFEIAEEDIPTNCCYACEISCYDCRYCPIKWTECFSEFGDPCMILDSLYKHWYIVPRGSKERSELARAIANLPWNEKERD